MPPRLEPGRCAQGGGFSIAESVCFCPGTLDLRTWTKRIAVLAALKRFPTSSTPAAPHQRGVEFMMELMDERARHGDYCRGP